MLKISQVLECPHKASSPRTRHSRSLSQFEILRPSCRTLFPYTTLFRSLKGDVPGASLERLGEPSRYLTVVWNASMSRPQDPTSELQSRSDITSRLPVEEPQARARNPKRGGVVMLCWDTYGDGTAPRSAR